MLSVRSIVIGLLLTVVLVAAAVAGVLALVAYERKAVFATWHDDKVGEIRVIGRSIGLLDGWIVTLCWKKPGGPWLLYGLAGDDSAWTDVRIAQQADYVVIERGDVRGRLVPRDGIFHRVAGEGAPFAQKPSAMSFDDDPRREEAWIYEDTPRWKATWPSLFPAATPKGTR